MQIEPTIAGIPVPCFSCENKFRRCHQNEIFRKVACAIGLLEPKIECADYQEESFHGVKGVRA